MVDITINAADSVYDKIFRGLLTKSKVGYNQIYSSKEVYNNWFDLLSLHGIKLVNHEKIIIDQNKLPFLILTLESCN